MPKDEDDDTQARLEEYKEIDSVHMRSGKPNQSDDEDDASLVRFSSESSQK